MNGTAALAEHLDTRTDTIISAWRDVAEQSGDVPEAEGLSYVEFADHIPELLERLADRLRGRPTDAASEGAKHGQMRWHQGYDVTGVVGELGHLRATLIRATFAVARERDFALAELESACTVINEIISEAAVEAVRQFQEASRAETLAARAAADHRQAAVQDAWIAAEAERAKLRTLLERLPVGVWVVDAAGVVVVLNREGERIQDFPADRTIGKVDFHAGDATDRPFRPDGPPSIPVRVPIVRALRGETIEQEEVPWRQGDRERIIIASAAPLLGAGGAVVGAVAVAQEITGRKRLEADLAVSEAQFRGIVEHSPAMIWRVGPDGACDFANRTLCDFLGRAPEQVLGFGWADSIQPEDRPAFLDAYRGSIAGREPIDRTLRLRRHDGQYRSVTALAAPYFDARGTVLGYLGTCLDITDRIDLERSLEQQRAMAEEASRHKTRLLAALSHDARTPLNAVVLSVQLLEMAHLGEPDPEVQQCLRTIRNSVGNVLDLLGDLLNLTKIDAGAMPAELSRFPLTPTLAECLSSVEAQARAKGLAVRLEPDGLEDLVVETDRAKLKQILCNLLSNALRYTDAGHIRLYGERTPDQIRIAVEDTGLGIAPGDQQRIFDEFATLEQPHRQAGEGTGLGLAICRRLANLLKGEITLGSEPGRGSTFTLALPASAVVPPAEPGAAAAPPAEAAPAAAGAILIVEDHLTSRQTLARVLVRMGYRTLEAGNGHDALALARQERPRVILMDVNMPVMDGIDATLALRADPRTRDITIFALTGDVSLVNQRRIGDAGVDGYLEKPVTRDALKRALDALPRPPT